MLFGSKLFGHVVAFSSTDLYICKRTFTSRQSVPIYCVVTANVKVMQVCISPVGNLAPADHGSNYTIYQDSLPARKYHFTDISGHLMDSSAGV